MKAYHVHRSVKSAQYMLNNLSMIAILQVVFYSNPFTQKKKFCIMNSSDLPQTMQLVWWLAWDSSSGSEVWFLRACSQQCRIPGISSGSDSWRPPTPIHICQVNFKMVFCRCMISSGSVAYFHYSSFHVQLSPYKTQILTYK